MKIQNTNAYKAFDKTTASVVNQANSRKRIMSSVDIVKTIGFEKWKTVTDLPKKWYNIVKELAD